MQESTRPNGFFHKEWLLTASGAGLLLTSIYTKRLPNYSLRELEVLFMLYALFVVVNGLGQSGLISKASHLIEHGRNVPLKIVVATFFLSMLLTNDVVLIVIVPVALSLEIRRKDILVILLALAANAGAALTPVGNPQNLYLYWFYDLSAMQFIRTIAPFSLVFFFLLVIASLTLATKGESKPSSVPRRIERSSTVYGILLLILLLAVLHILPVWAAPAVILFVLASDRKALRVDYVLLFTFLLFFGLADNVRFLLASQIGRSDHIFLWSALSSQFISNVPVALLFAKFTANWQALLWGVNAGGFGSLLGSLANLIAYRLYVNHADVRDSRAFTSKFLAIGYLAFFLSIGMYYALQAIR